MVESGSEILPWCCVVCHLFDTYIILPLLLTFFLAQPLSCPHDVYILWLLSQVFLVFDSSCYLHFEEGTDCFGEEETGLLEFLTTTEYSALYTQHERTTELARKNIAEQKKTA